MSVQIIQAPIEDRLIIRNLYQFYAYESSDWDDTYIGLDGLYYMYDPYFNQYWELAGWSAHYIKVDDVIAGFLLIERSDIPGLDAPEFADFFIFKKFRRQGIGKAVVTQVIGTDSPWVINVFREDTNAMQFWQSIFQSLSFRSIRELQDHDGRDVSTYLLNEAATSRD